MTETKRPERGAHVRFPPPLVFLGGRFTRNPMYLGMTIILLGLGLAWNNLWISLFAIPALLVVHVIAVVPEERYLSEKFGDNTSSGVAGPWTPFS